MKAQVREGMKPIKGPLVGNCSMDNPFLYSDTLCEGLICTYPIETAIRYLKDYLGYTGEYGNLIKIEDMAQGTKGITVAIGNDWSGFEERKNDAIKCLRLCGYSLVRTKHKYDTTILEFEPKNGNDLKDILKLHKHLYHAAPLKYKDKILKIGLVPKSKNKKFTHPPRVYLAYTQAGALNIVSQLEDINTSTGGVPNKLYCIFEIDVSKLPRPVKFERDSKYEWGCWTYENIPPSVISVVGVVSFREDE